MALRPEPPVTEWGRAFQVSLEFGLCVVIGVVAGYYLDRWLGTGPLFLLALAAAGFAAGLRNLLRLTR